MAQAIAVIPGVSRSGITMSAGLFAKLDRAEAATFAFLLSAPIVAGAGAEGRLRRAQGSASGNAGSGGLRFLRVGLSLAAMTGYLTIGFLLRFLRGAQLLPVRRLSGRAGGFVLAAVLLTR